MNTSLPSWLATQALQVVTFFFHLFRAHWRWGLHQLFFWNHLFLKWFITWLKIILKAQVCLNLLKHMLFSHFLPVLEFLTTNFSPCENLFKELFSKEPTCASILRYILILEGLVTQSLSIQWSQHDQYTIQNVRLEFCDGCMRHRPEIPKREDICEHHTWRECGVNRTLRF